MLQLYIYNTDFSMEIYNIYAKSYNLILDKKIIE